MKTPSHLSHLIRPHLSGMMRARYMRAHIEPGFLVDHWEVSRAGERIWIGRVRVATEQAARDFIACCGWVPVLTRTFRGQSEVQS